MGKLNVDSCRKLKVKNIVMPIDSSGFKVFGEDEWKVRKHVKGYRRTWRKTHIAIDYDTRVLLDPSIPSPTRTIIPSSGHYLAKSKKSQVHNVKTIIGDGAYDAKDNYLLAKQLNLELIYPPCKSAVEHPNFRPQQYEVYDAPGPRRS
jgi:hypothetical protein